MNQFYLQYPNGFNNYCLCLYSSDRALVEQFRRLCITELNRKFRWFHQADYPDYQKFEFWIGTEEEIRQECLRIASLMKLELAERR